MFGRIFAGGACATLALIVIAGPARAEGTANVRQSDGSTENYVHVHLRLSGQPNCIVTVGQNRSRSTTARSTSISPEMRKR